MKGYKGFEPGLICRGKQYAENTVFEEDSAKICSKGMHFCENPFDVLEHYGFVGKNGTGDYSAAIVEGKESVAINLGIEGKAKGKIGCWITLAEWKKDKSCKWHRIDVQTRKVDGETIKADVFYMLKAGEFVEVE